MSTNPSAFTGPVPYFVSGTVAPAAAANTNGAPFTVTPPAGYTKLLILHIGLSNFGVAAETVTTTCNGTLTDGTTQAGTNTYTSNAGDMDNQHYLEPSWGVGAGSGLSSLGAGKWCTQAQFLEQSTIVSSLASQTIRVWALAYQ